MKKVCIVGASGKLGQYMVQHALDRGYEVVGVCRERSVGKLDGLVAPIQRMLYHVLPELSGCTHNTNLFHMLPYPQWRLNEECLSGAAQYSNRRVDIPGAG